MAKQGFTFIIILILLALAMRMVIPGSRAIPALFMLFAAFTAFFFRDPGRVIPGGDNLVISPADGRIVFTGEVERGHFIDGPAKKISVFMSLVDVHVNRAPVSGDVKEIVYNKGRFFRADTDKASLDNEQNWVIMEKGKKKLAFVQIAGLIARRIVCDIEEGQRLSAGQKVGLIMFGSRVDVYLPLDATISVKIGDRVRAGETVIGKI